MSESPAKNKGEWQEYKAQDGRTYWSHSVTKQSTWDKPDDLKTPFEWELPKELKDLKQRLEDDEKEEKEEAEGGDEAGSENGGVKRIADRVQDDSQALTKRDPNQESSRNRSPSPAPSILESIDDPLTILGPEPVVPPGGFHNSIEAEQAFIYLLKKCKVDQTWSWDVTIRKIITEPLYKSLKTLAEKKDVWQKYTADLVANAEAIKQEKVNRLRPHFKKLFQQHRDQIKYFSTFKTAERLFENDRVWNSLDDMEDRRALFEEYVNGLKTAKQNTETALRQRNMAVMKSLITQLPITVSTRWRDARNMIIESPEFKADKSLQTIDDIDILEIYDDYSSSLIREHAENMRKAQSEKARRARKARDGFRELLADLEAKGEITSRMKWKEFVKLVEDSEAYEKLLGMPGSAPLDLFRDVVDDIAEAVGEAIKRVNIAAERSEKKIELGMSRQEFDTFLEENKLTGVIDPKRVSEVYDIIQSRLEKDAADQKRRAERKRRHLIDDLRYGMKKADPSIDLDGTYEDVLEADVKHLRQSIPAMEKLREFKDLDEEGRKEAFDKFIKRQKEKIRERTRERERDRERDAATSDADGSATGHKSRTHRRSPSPAGSDLRSSDKRARHDRERSERDREGGHRSRDKERYSKDKKYRDERYDDDRDGEERRRSRTSKDEYRSRRKGDADEEPLDEGHVAKKPRVDEDQPDKAEAADEKPTKAEKTAAEEGEISMMI
ncbi:hypothetical protein QFC21_002234 [Naganishia friedmannii]|uniref:Uncharacterized protein n=1 Tax=Naganishia friedmannii TaxID=89922 RepID=A0ACC2VZG7_9TREE|nr:hypothetical protein QFC21_002234 [Naganishia friedmannii]